MWYISVHGADIGLDLFAPIVSTLACLIGYMLFLSIRNILPDIIYDRGWILVTIIIIFSVSFDIINDKKSKVYHWWGINSYKGEVVSNKIPITLPLFIAMTAIARLIILQGKGMDPIILLYEAGAILIIALACLVIRFKPLNTYIYQSEDEDSLNKLKNKN